MGLLKLPTVVDSSEQILSSKMLMKNVYKNYLFKIT